jgi:amino acid transporter
MRMKTIALSAFITFALPALSFAQERKIDYEQGKGDTPQLFIDVFRKVGNWLFTFLLIFAVLMILIAGFKYLFSGGGEKVKEANKMLIYAVVAVTVGLLAAGIPWTIENLIIKDQSQGLPTGDDLQRQVDEE